MDLTDLTITEAHEGLKNKKFSSKELTLAYLEKIEKTDYKINAYLSVTKDLALRQAEKADKIIKEEKDFSILNGIPCAIKDNILVEGAKCTAGSKILENYIAPYDATLVRKLKEKGAVILGKTNLDEFAMGSSTENSAFKITKNPNDLKRVPGGSSGGSVASVAAKEAIYAIGTDTGGSIRQPASFCGVVGLKPTYGAVSRYGLIAFASSLDQAGPLTKNVEDCKTVFEAITGKDPLDSTSTNFKFQTSNLELSGARIGIPKEYFGKGIESGVKDIIKNAIKKAEELGARIIEISLPSIDYALACYYILAPSEASSNLARYDGITYGLSNKNALNLLEVYLKSRGNGFGPEVKRRVMLGTYSLSSGYYDAYYKKAQEVRELIKQDFAKAFEKVDLIMGPTSPFPAFKIGEKSNDPMQMYLADIYTVSVNIAGLPAISLPAGKIGKSKTLSGAEGLPVGLQIIGNYFEENKILGFAKEMEKMLEYK